jgi:transcriptional regulator with XRE-family HTH domain
MTQRGLSYRALAARTRVADPRGVGLTAGHLANLVAGRDPPSPRALQLLAAALDLPATHFAEYRLAELRRQVDERAVGLPAALRRYRQLTGSR